MKLQDIYDYSGYSHFRSGQIGEAIQRYDEAINIGRENKLYHGKILYNKALAYKAIDNLEEYGDCLDEAMVMLRGDEGYIQKFPREGQYHFDLAIIYAEKLRFTDDRPACIHRALDSLDCAITQNPKFKKWASTEPAFSSIVEFGIGYDKNRFKNLIDPYQYQFF